MYAKLTISHAKQLALRRDGECLSSEYINSSSPLEWKCSKNHIWLAPYNYIQQNHWCPKCGGTKKLSIEDMREIARQRKGRCLSKIYSNVITPLTWECAKGHIWEAQYNGVINKGAWCPTCGFAKLSEPRKYSIIDLQKIASSRDGKCLSTKYTNIMDRHLWECGQGHQWEGRANDVIHSKSWCPVCSLKYNKTEKLCRKIIEDSTGLKFPATRQVLGKNYELDMYNAQYRLAFEYDGEQHFIFKKHWHKDTAGFKRQQDRDQYKNDLCKKIGITLERINYVDAKKGRTVLGKSLNKQACSSWGPDCLVNALIKFKIIDAIIGKAGFLFIF